MNNYLIKKNQNEQLFFTDFKEDNLKIKLENNSHLNSLYFSRLKENKTIDIDVERDASIDLKFILMNSDSHIDLNININGENADVKVSTLSLAKDTTKTLNINIIHNAKYTNSVVVNNGISFHEGHNVFNVNGTIKEQMAGSNARQITRGLILDSTGSCKALPILYIDNYDVKAYHGATIGKVNDEDLFYLMSRGLSKQESFMLIINGILEPFIKDLSDENLKNEIMNKYLSYFGE